MYMLRIITQLKCITWFNVRKYLILTHTGYLNVL